MIYGSDQPALNCGARGIPQLIVDQPKEEAHSIFPPDGRSPESGWRLDQGFHMTPLKQDFTNVSEGHGGWPLILLN